MAGIVSQRIVFQIWKGRKKLYSKVTVHRCTRYLSWSVRNGGCEIGKPNLRKWNRRSKDTLQTGQCIDKLVEGRYQAG